MVCITVADASVMSMATEANGGAYPAKRATEDEAADVTDSVGGTTIPLTLTICRGITPIGKDKSADRRP